MTHAQFLVITLVASYVIFEFHRECTQLVKTRFKKTKCRLGFHMTGKNKYYCLECKKPSKGYLKVIDGEGKYKMKEKDFKF
jgi:hypothetical protein